MMPRRFKEKFLIIMCPYCEKVLRHGSWIEMDKRVVEEWKKNYACVIKYEDCQLCGNGKEVLYE